MSCCPLTAGVLFLTANVERRHPDKRVSKASTVHQDTQLERDTLAVGAPQASEVSAVLNKLGL